MSEFDRLLVECHGGPWDGRRIVDRGPQFSVTSALGSDGMLQPERREVGVYERRPDGYHWRPHLGEGLEGTQD